jgi:hypothetical protein
LGVSRDTLVEDVKRVLTDPKAVTNRLGLKSRRSSRGVQILCPVHGEKNPSCSVIRGREGTLQVTCFSCKWTGDVLALVAAVNGLDLRSDFREVLATTAELAGMHDEARAVRDGKPPPERERPPAPVPEPERDYPPADEVRALWETARPLLEDEPAAVCLLGRRIMPDVVTALDAVRALLPETHPSRIPEWARFRGQGTVSRAWNRSGHRIIVPVYDSDGAFRSLRAWLVTGEPNVPKRVPPVGHKAGGLVLANARAVKMLRGEASPSRVVIVEGEPDTLARCVTNPDEVIIGILSGSWHEGFASRIPYGSEVVVRTHVDPAGERYANNVIQSIKSRARVRRLQHEAA